MSTNVAAAIPNDLELKRLAAEPARPLFPLLDQAEAMLPLVLVLAFLPSLYALTYGTLTKWGALQGLVGLDYLATGGPVDLADLARLEPQQSLRFQPPLMSWLTALGIKITGVGHAVGAMVPAFLCTAGLVVSVYVLGRRLGGERLALVSAGLLAFNPLILAGAQEPVPQSATMFAAVLALAGVITHWQKSSSLVSYQLLLAGIALGLCLLAGGAIAMAVVAVIVLYVVLWKCTDRRVTRSGIVSDRIRFSRRMAFRSTLVLVATAFAVGGWDVLLLSSRYGSQFWEGWLGSAALTKSARPLALDRVWDLCRLAWPLLGMTLLGLWAIVRDIYRGDEEAARRHRGLLAVWSLVALGLALWTGAAPSAADAAQIWATFLAVPVVMTAALGTLQIAERRVGFGMALTACAMSLAVVAADRWFLAHHEIGAGTTIGPGDHTLHALLAPALLTGLIAGIAWFVADGRERSRRVVLSGLLAAILLVNVAWGLDAVRRTEVGDRQLQELRVGLERFAPVERLVFVDLSPAGNGVTFQPPPQLLFVLRSLCPTAKVSSVTAWDAPLPAPDTPSPVANDAVLFVGLSPRGRARGSSPAAGFRAATSPLYYRDLEIVAFVGDRLTRSRSADAADVRTSNN